MKLNRLAAISTLAFGLGCNEQQPNAPICQTNDHARGAINITFKVGEPDTPFHQSREKHVQELNLQPTEEAAPPPHELKDTFIYTTRQKTGIACIPNGTDAEGHPVIYCTNF